MTVFCTLSCQFVQFGLDSGLSFALRSYVGGSYHVVWNWAGSALLSGNPKIRNRKETETRNHRKQVLQIQCRWKITVRTFAFNLKVREQIKKSSNKNSLSVEICATHTSSEGYDCENLRALHGGRLSWLTGVPS